MKSFLFKLFIVSFSLFFLLLNGCKQEEKANVEIKYLDPAEAAESAKQIRKDVTVTVGDGLELTLWATDSLAPDPVALDVDDQGRVYLTRTNRQKHSEFDIRGHVDWMTASISLKTVEDRRAFLKKTFAPENSAQNEWLDDLNGDGSHDWRDLAVEQEEIFRLEDQSGDGVADMAQLYLRDFNTEITDVAGALMAYKDNVFVGLGPDMWRTWDDNGDGQADRKESISHGYNVHIGFGGHGMSGLRVGPDGRIYWGIGDIGSYIVDKTGKVWDNANQGAIFRSNPDGTDFEVFARGLRNTHEFVFDEYGNLMSVDNDGDHPGES
ncbi:MAG: heme-binding protein, partial [Bacteroidetes bacterium]|nr:heme-binding protein [Bacteroidota bacterium]